MAGSIQRSYREFVGAVADVLDDLNIEYGIAGSFASSQYGEPRQTLDVDLRLDLNYLKQWATQLQVLESWQKLWAD